MRLRRLQVLSVSAPVKEKEVDETRTPTSRTIPSGCSAAVEKAAAGQNPAPMPAWKGSDSAGQFRRGTPSGPFVATPRRGRLKYHNSFTQQQLGADALEHGWTVPGHGRRRIDWGTGGEYAYLEHTFSQ